MDGNKKAGSHSSHVSEELEMASVEEIIHTNSHHIVIVTRCLGVEEEPAVEANDYWDSSIAHRNKSKEEVLKWTECGDEVESKEVEEPDKDEHELR